MLIIPVEWLEFPRNRDTLVDYLSRGLSLRHLLPKDGTERQGRITCKARLILFESGWVQTGTCNRRESTWESYQRHIKRDHLGIHGKSLSMDFVVRGMSVFLPCFLTSLTPLVGWGYATTIPRPQERLRVRPWDPDAQKFPQATTSRPWRRRGAGE